MDSSSFLIILVSLFLIAFWISQFTALMNMRDSVFNGRYDKLIWAAVLILLNVFGAFVFWIWDRARLNDLKAKKNVNNVLSHAISSDD